MRMRLFGLGWIREVMISLSLFLCAHGALDAVALKDPHIEPRALAELFSSMGIQQENYIEQTQKQWLRKPNHERWEIEELSDDKRAIVLNWAKRQNLYHAWTPERTAYDKALIFGGTTKRMHLRLEHLKMLWLNGVRFKEVVWLTGERPLDKRADDMIKICKTESDAAKVLWKSIDLPQEMRNLPVLFIDVPMGVKRPTTEDTLLAWLKTSPEPCSLLFISNQPFCGFQFAVIYSTLPSSFDFDLVGREVDPDQYPAIAATTLDSISRWLDQLAKSESQ